MSLRIKMEWKGKDAQRAVANATPRALFAAMSVVKQASDAQIPLDKGDLLRSGAIDVGDGDASISYDTPYAIRWHENDANFQRGRKKKYLEDPINDPDVQKRALIALQYGMKLE